MAILKNLLFLLIFSVLSYATSLDNVKSQMLYNISAMLTNKEKINIYINDKQFDDFKTFKNKLIRVYDCNKAEILLTNKVENLPENCLHKIIICTKFKTFKNNPNVTGAIFWQKGRINIIFKKKKMEEFSIKINKTLEQYLY